MKLPRAIRSTLLQAYRAAVLLAVLGLIRWKHQEWKLRTNTPAVPAISLASVRQLFPHAATLGGSASARQGLTVSDASSHVLGYVAQTSPASDAIIGYSGPTDTLIGFNPQHKIIGLLILSSGDTPEHAAKVARAHRFLHSFDGLGWTEAARRAHVDAVSGATLTSLAVAEGVVRRLGGSPPSYQFPQEISLSEVRTFFPSARQLVPTKSDPALIDVRDAAGRNLGKVMRTAPAADSIVGYRGPTDTLVALDPHDKVLGIAVRHSYDTPHYVGYVTQDSYFSNRFNGFTLDKLAHLNLEQAGVEGVSGATMTSLAVAQGLVRAAQQHFRSRQSSPAHRAGFPLPDAGTLGIVAIALLIAFSPLRHRKAVRCGFQVLLVGYLGLLNGELLSQALLVGWAGNGVPWRLAPGLVLLTSAALVVPLVTRTQLYCHYLCPHGALQELVKHRVPGQLRPPRLLARLLSWLPPLLLLWVLWVALRGLPFNLAAIEPFDAYLWKVAGWGSLAVAITGLAASLFVPMAYCRFGCPTGFMLRYLRFNRRSNQFSARDGLALLLLGAALLLIFT